MQRSPLVLVGLDSASHELIRRYVDEGLMPNLAGLIERGYGFPLKGRLHGFHANSWMRLIEGVDVSPWYFAKYWRPATMGFGLARDGAIEPRRPFWADLVAAGQKVALVDVPQTGRDSDWGASIFIKGWQKTNDQRLVVKPPTLTGPAGSPLDRPMLDSDPYGRPSADGLERLRDQVLDATRAAGRLGAELIGRHKPDCLLIVFSATHRAGHYLWDLSQLAGQAVPAERRRRLEVALDEAHAELDRAIGQLVEAASADTRFIVFSPYGMERNNGWTHQLPRIVERLVLPDRGGRRPSLIGRLRDRLPSSMIRSALGRLPEALVDRAVGHVSPWLLDWRRTQVMVLPGEPEGYLRLNLKGRERSGAVEPAAATALLGEIEAALREIRTVETDEPIIQDIQHTDVLVSPDHPDRRHLPDMVLLFRTDIAADQFSGVRRAGVGEVRWPPGEPYPSGRSGNHAADGFCIATGPGFPVGHSNQCHDTIDLTATFQAMAGLEVAERLDGRPIEVLVGADARVGAC